MSYFVLVNRLLKIREYHKHCKQGLINFIDVFYHHRASAWGIKIQDNYLITGSMDKTISLINLSTLKVEKHFLAHEDEWGGKLLFS